MSEKTFNENTDPEWNTEPGIAVIPGSKFQKHMAQFEQFPYSKFANGNPGNPYVYRPFPKMVYRAQDYNGKNVCNAVEPDISEFANQGEWQRALTKANRFNQECQLIVNNEQELQRAFEANYRESPQEAIALLESKKAAHARAAAELNYEERRMSEPARREVAAERAATDGHLAEVPRKRGRPRKNPTA